MWGGRDGQQGWSQGFQSGRSLGQGRMEQQPGDDDDVPDMLAASQSGFGGQWAPARAAAAAAPPPHSGRHGDYALPELPSQAPVAPRMDPLAMSSSRNLVSSARYHASPFGNTGKQANPWSPRGTGGARDADRGPVGDPMVAHGRSIYKLGREGVVVRMLFNTRLGKADAGKMDALDALDELDAETRWMDVLREPCGKDKDGKITEDSHIRALLRLGFPPSNLRRLRDLFETLEAAISNANTEPANAEDEELRMAQKLKAYKELIEKGQKLLGLRTHTTELLFTTRASDNPDRIFHERQASLEQTMALSRAGGRPGEDPYGASVSMSPRIDRGSQGKHVCTFNELMANVLVFTPVGSPHQKLELLMEMFDCDTERRKDELYFALSDMKRMLRWLMKEADMEADDEEGIARVDAMIEEDYLRHMNKDLSDTDQEDADAGPGRLAELTVRHETLVRDGYHRLVLQEVLLAPERGRPYVPSKPQGMQVLTFGLRNRKYNNQQCEIKYRLPGVHDKYLVEFPDGMQRELKGVNLRFRTEDITHGEVRDADTWGLALPLTLNIRPEQDPPPRPTSAVGWRTVWKWLCDNIFSLALTASIVAMFVAPLYVRYLNRDDLHDLLGNAVALSGGAAWALRFVIILSIVTGCNVVWRQVPKWLQPDPLKLPWLHAILGVTAVVFILIHVVAASVVMARMTDRDAAALNGVLGTSFSNGSISATDLIVSTPGWSGIGLFCAVAVLLGGSAARSDGKCFQFTHLMIWVVVALSIIHPFEGWFEWKYGSAAWYALPLLMLIAETALRCTSAEARQATKVKAVKGTGGRCTGIEWVIRRPEGNQMVCQQAGEYIEIQCPDVSQRWQPAVPVSAPELEDEEVRIQYTSRTTNSFLKQCKHKVMTGEQKIKTVRVRGPFGLAASDVLSEDNGWGGKVILTADEEGIVHLTAVLNDIAATLNRHMDSHRTTVSRLHELLVEMLTVKPGERPRLGICVVACCRAADGYKRFTDALMRLLSLLHGDDKDGTGQGLQEGLSLDMTGADMRLVNIAEQKQLQLSLRFYCSSQGAAGFGVDTWKRMRMLAKQGKSGSAEAFQQKLRLLGWHTFYGTPDWTAIFRQCRFEWLNETVEVLHWGDSQNAEMLRTLCTEHSYNPNQPTARPDDKTVFNFHHGHTPAAVVS